MASTASKLADRRRVTMKITTWASVCAWTLVALVGACKGSVSTGGTGATGGTGGMGGCVPSEEPSPCCPDCDATTTGVTTGTSGTTGLGGAGGHGGAPMMVCPSTPPSNGSSCAGFAEGQQCNYDSTGSGMTSSTECQCGGGSVWSCGTEAVGAGSSTSSG
jgi:hypothetical protein